METHHQEFRVTCLCRVLQVSRSGFSGWCIIAIKVISIVPRCIKPS